MIEILWPSKVKWLDIKKRETFDRPMCKINITKKKEAYQRFDVT